METIASGGAEIPALGFGVFRMSGDEVERVVPAALAAGFRHFDTAQIYDNEAALGRALATAGVPRDELFLTTKIWVDNYGAERFAASVEESLARLRVERVDLLLLHWPGREVPVEAQVERLNAVREAGLTRYIGVSNYNVPQLETAIRASAAPIVTNQVEVHPYLDQSRIHAAATRHGIALTAYFAMADGRVPADPALAAIGARYGKSAAQVVLRWLVQRGIVTLSKTARPERVAENAAIFDFALGGEDMAAIAALARPGGRLAAPPGIAPDWDAESDDPPRP
jgi:2,5-diketo-D-gluconate reductase B